MRLTPDEREILAGRDGEFRAFALDALVQFGEAFDAPRLTPISYAHYPAEMSIYPGQVEQGCLWADRGARAAVPTTTTTLACDLDRWDVLGCPAPVAEAQARAARAHERMGLLPTYTCAPFRTGHEPGLGDRIVSAESSAVVFFNSVLGARANRGGQLARLAALVGRTPELGYLRDESRAGTHLFEMSLGPEHLRHAADWSLLGYAIGKITGGGVPVLRGLPPAACTRENLVALGASLATSGSVALFHVPGVTPEAPDLAAAFRGAAPPAPIRIGPREMGAARADLNPPSGGEVDFVTLGCPHHDLAAVERIAAALEGRRVASGVRLWVCTARATRRAAVERGSAAAIERAGGHLVADTCPVEAHLRKSTCREHGLAIPQCRMMVTDSVKMARYVRDLIGCGSVLESERGCIESALSGRWEPRPWP